LGRDPEARHGHARVVDVERHAVTIRSERDDPREWATIAAVVEAAFASAVEADLVAAIRASGNLVDGGSLVADRDGAVVGHVMLSAAFLHGPGGRRRVVTLSPLAVAPPLQRSGIGSALVCAVIELADRAGEPLLFVEGDPAYYARFGFEPSAPLGIVTALPEWAPPEAAQLRRLRNYDPSITGRLVYPGYFPGP
jgi:putative acetyltransferase